MWQVTMNEVQLLENFLAGGNRPLVFFTYYLIKSQKFKLQFANFAKIWTSHEQPPREILKSRDVLVT